MRPSTKTLLAAAGLATLAAGFGVSRTRTRVAEARNPPPGRVVEVDGVRMHALQQGEGPDVLLIHGAAMMGAEMMLALGHALPLRRVTAVDRPGHGHSDKRRRPSLQTQAELIHGVAERLGLERPVLVGHSLGGPVALAYGEMFPGEVAGVVVVAPLAYPGWGPAHAGRALRGAPLVGPALSNTLTGMSDPLVMRAATRLIFSPQKPTDAFRRTIDVDLLARPSAMVADGADFVRASMDLEALSRRYADYPLPVHVIVGGKDRVLKPARQGLRLAEALPDVRLTVEPELGHMLHHFAAETVAAAVDAMSLRAGSPPRAAEAIDAALGV